jgi:hypothetical protein
MMRMKIKDLWGVSWTREWLFDGSVSRPTHSHGGVAAFSAI